MKTPDPSRLTGIHTLWVVTIALCFFGCSTWGRPRTEIPTRPVDRLLVWSGGDAYDLHTINITDSTVSGVPWGRGGSCEECRVSFPLARVDSLQLEDFSRARTVVLTSVLGMMGLSLLMLSQLGGT